MKSAILTPSTPLSTTSESDSLARSVLFTRQLNELFHQFKPFLGQEFHPWFESLIFPEEVLDALNEAGTGLFELHAFVFHFTWNPVENTWKLQWRVDENKLSPDYPLDRTEACLIQLQKVEQTLIDSLRRRVCQTYEENSFQAQW